VEAFIAAVETQPRHVTEISPNQVFQQALEAVRVRVSA